MQKVLILKKNDNKINIVHIIHTPTCINNDLNNGIYKHLYAYKDFLQLKNSKLVLIKK